MLKSYEYNKYTKYTDDMDDISAIALFLSHRSKNNKYVV